jgi:hypothetical protein
LINPLTKARRTVAEAVANGVWIDDIKKPINIQSFLQVVDIWEGLAEIQLNQNLEDAWTWTWDAKGYFASKSVYMAHYASATQCGLAKKNLEVLGATSLQLGLAFHQRESLDCKQTGKKRTSSQ